MSFWGVFWLFLYPSFRIGTLVGLPAIPCRNSHTRSQQLDGMPKAGQTDSGASSKLLGEDVLLRGGFR